MRFDAVQTIKRKEKNMNTQNKRLLSYLEKHGNITQLEALTELGVFRLASRINDLKNKGYRISGKMVEVKNRFNEKVKIKRYYLEQENG